MIWRRLSVLGSASFELLLAVAIGGPCASAATHTERLAKIVAAAEEVDAMRESLARALPAGDKIDEGTFAQVCKPVGQRARALGKELDVDFIQMSDRFRNPQHKADAGAESALKAFRGDPKLETFLIRTSEGGTTGYRYFRRITVRESCLACHGEKAARPSFVKEKYPGDLAFGFAAGDLRGVYSIAWTE